MTILVCPLSKVAATVAARAPERVVSLLDPDFASPQLGAAYVGGKHLRLRFHDVHSPKRGQVVASRADVEELLAFVRGWDRRGPILIHCRAGVGRSTAGAFITACVHNPQTEEREIAAELRRVAPLARPNEALLRLADAALGRGTRLYDAIEETGRGLSWLDVEDEIRANGEGRAFELPSRFAPSAS